VRFGRAREVPVLAVEHLKAVHRSRGRVVVAARDVSLAVHPGESLALVGESGSGKTTIARCIAGLHRPSGGQISLHGEPIAPRAQDRSRETRRRCQIVFQNPYDSLNPRRRIGDQISWSAQVLRGLSAREARAEAARLMGLVRLPTALLEQFPRELSGGERQRVAIARAVVAQPDILICDEITSELDVSVQAAVIDLLFDLRATLELAVLFISHDLGLVASIADRVIVLESGVLCEEGSIDDVLRNPAHEYTQRLLAAAPRLPESTPASNAAVSS
jgi:peptide/nickel transport system ATP-binding protein